MDISSWTRKFNESVIALLPLALVAAVGLGASQLAQAKGGGDWDFEDRLQPVEARLVVEATLASTIGSRCDSDGLERLIRPLIAHAKGLVAKAQVDSQFRRDLPLSTSEFDCLVETVKRIESSAAGE